MGEDRLVKSMYRSSMAGNQEIGADKGLRRWIDEVREFLAWGEMREREGDDWLGIGSLGGG